MTETLYPDDGAPRAASTEQPSWQNLFEQHIHILNEHLTLWNTVRGQQLPGSDNHSAAEDCVKNTQEMIRNFENLRTSFAGEDSTPKPETTTDTRPGLTRSSSDAPLAQDLNGSGQDLSRPSKRQRTEEHHAQPTTIHQTQSVKDISDLFSIDITSTPVDQLQASKSSKRASKELKRKLSQSGLHPIGLSEPLREVEPLQKRSKQLSMPGTLRTETKVHSAEAEAKEDPGDEEDSFIAKVQQKLSEKEIKRQKKLDKKRKRQSNTSIEDHTHDNGGDSGSKAGRPTKKKLKQSNSQSANVQLQTDMVGKQTNAAAATKNQAGSGGNGKPKKRKK